jgi:hypothetical protein
VVGDVPCAVASACPPRNNGCVLFIFWRAYIGRIRVGTLLESNNMINVCLLHVVSYGTYYFMACQFLSTCIACYASKDGGIHIMLSDMNCSWVYANMPQESSASQID